MSRLSARHYLQTRKRLGRYWDHQQIGYSYLSSTEQWQLHDFFKPTKEWSDDQALEHRAEVTRERPSLPHQAGRALAKLDEIAPRLALATVRAAKQPAVSPRAATHSGRRSQDRQITVRSVVKPEIDTERLARALMAFALERSKNQRASGDSIDVDTTSV